MKKIMCGMLLVVTVLILTACGDSVEGTQYEDDSSNTELVLTSDGTFSTDGFGGTYSFEDNRVTLVADFMGASIVLEKTTIDGNEVLTDGEYTYYRDLEAIQAIQAEEEAAEEASREAERQEREAKSEEFASWLETELPGRWSQENDEGGLFALLELNEDGTYTYKEAGWSPADTWGEWSVEREYDKVKVVFTETEDEDAYDTYGEPHDQTFEYNSLEQYKEEIESGEYTIEGCTKEANK